MGRNGDVLMVDGGILSFKSVLFNYCFILFSVYLPSLGIVEVDIHGATLFQPFWELLFINCKLLHPHFAIKFPPCLRCTLIRQQYRQCPPRHFAA
jgi:hypothetical protein